ncbi:hypothetical protein [Loktanella sp. M215]|uniref:hypothetical protein n=1 Tax=Loktanella sp. M215 TaxID=2675431 RepID=UPI001F2A75D4|nr:hypothetical protein [Loktanella sp. M215]MCF7698238.1 hypothetical protein [Loktanella sp. M215]
MRELGERKHDFIWDLEQLAEKGGKIFDKLLKPPALEQPPFWKPANVLKRSVYRIGQQIADRQEEAFLAEFVQNYMSDWKNPLVRKSAPHPEENPFFWCYHLLAGGCPHISRDQRSKSARQLVYAYRHNIPTELVIGFIMQCKHTEASRGPDDGLRESWFLTDHQIT